VTAEFAGASPVVRPPDWLGVWLLPVVIRGSFFASWRCAVTPYMTASSAAAITPVTTHVRVVLAGPSRSAGSIGLRAGLAGIVPSPLILVGHRRTP
jgi:hypothetical protein